MKKLRSFRSVGAIAIIIMAASAISMTNISDAESEVNPELLALTKTTSWTFLGSRAINTKKEFRTIRLNRGLGRMAKIQLRLKHHYMKIEKVVLHFKGGGTQEVEMKPNAIGEMIYLIEVEAGGQVVRKVTVWPKLNYDMNANEFNNSDIVSVWGVSDWYLRSGYNEINYPSVQYATFGELIKSQHPRREVSSIFCSN